MSSTPNITGARGWAKPYTEGVVFHFPSGNKAIVRPVNMDSFILYGGIPDSLTPLVVKMINNEPMDKDQLTREEFLAACELQDVFCMTCFIAPRVVKEVKNADEEITPAMISDMDKAALFGLMGAPASALADFRPFTFNTLGDMVGEQGDTPSAE